MRSVYVRPCNFVHGKHATFLIQKKQALPICGNRSIAFTHVEIITKKKIKDKLLLFPKLTTYPNNIKNKFS